MDAFISHSSKDTVLAARTEELLEEDGLKVWLDHSEIRLGALLRPELQTAIKNSRVLVLLWSQAAAKSRWVAAEVMTAFHLNRFTLACVRGNLELPYFLQNTIYLKLQLRKTDWAEHLRRAVREAPDAANDVPTMMARQSQELQDAIHRIVQGQMEVTNHLANGDLRGAKEKQQLVDRITVDAKKAWPLESTVLNLAGYHHKNAYLLKHWPAIQAGRPPKDRLLMLAESCFFKALFVNPNDYGALNGLGSILILGRDLEAAEFFIRRAIALAEQAGINYPAAEHDLATILAFKRE
jgi:tetratricopeptide (TPR) repeat protein